MSCPKIKNHCHWYYSENEDGDYVHDRTNDNGFCILQDLFTACHGVCPNYIKDDGPEDKTTL